MRAAGGRKREPIGTSAGRSGAAVLFVTPREKHLLNSIERVSRQKLVESQLPSVDDVNDKRVEKFRELAGLF